MCIMLVSIFKRNYEFLSGIMTPYGTNLSKTKGQHKYRFRKEKNIKKYTRRRVDNTEQRERPEKYGQAELRTQFALKDSKTYPFLRNLNENQP